MTAERPTPVQPPDRRISEDAQSAALQGASLAFGKPPVKPKPVVSNYSGNNGALAAATQSTGGTSRKQARPPSMQEEKDLVRLRGMEESNRLKRQNSGASVASERGTGNGGRGRGRGRGTVQQRASQHSLDTNGGSAGDGMGSLRPGQSRSASFIAATLAASRSSSLSPHPPGTNYTQPLNSPTPDLRVTLGYGSRTSSVQSGESSRNSSDQPLDTRSIPPTSNLVGMFEQNVERVGAEKTLRRFKTSNLIRQTAGISQSASATPARARTPSPLATNPQKSPPQLKSPKPTAAAIARAQLLNASVSSLNQSTTSKANPPPALDSQKPSVPPAKPIAIPSKTPPASRKTSDPTIRSNNKKVEKDNDVSSEDSFVSASDYQESSYKPSWRAELNTQNRHLTAASIHSFNSSVTVDSLANAIVASSLASSRAGSPSKHLQQQTSSLYPPMPPPRRSKNHHSHLFHNEKDMGRRTPSPNKQQLTGGAGGGGILRATMRKQKSKESLDEGEKRRGRRHLVKKHPNKHHEGDRKRWRDTVTERERKRYEAVWASNKGLYTSLPNVQRPNPDPATADHNTATGSVPTSSGLMFLPPGVDPALEVCSLVVRDIYSRSRLHVDVLEEVYSLVDRRGIGSLGKEEFVVGLWLVDQRLKGRKLPIRVNESIWRSVGVLGGIKVRGLK